MPKADTKCPRSSTHRKASSCNSDDNIEQMAQRNVLCMQKLGEHLKAAVEGRDSEEVAQAYDRVINSGRVLLPNTPLRNFTENEIGALDSVLCSPAANLEDHIFLGMTAHTLLMLQLETMKSLPYDIMDRIDARTIELRSQMRSRREHPPLEQDKITALVLPHPPPQLKRPISTRHIPLSSATVCDMLAAPLTLLGKGFILQDADLYYCITSVVASLQECTFTLQYEDTSYPIEDVSSKAVLQFSIYLIFVLPLLIELKFAPCHSILSKKDGNNPRKCNFSKEFTIGLERQQDQQIPPRTLRAS
ncbi:hypothetical protein EDD16DRAFT_1515657 [Pisolithus croceorrhizus]|nr:hypothetical protein EDD16DRAFT_1515657 [Pisolithus croceorrhizus]KAI6164771.1 hypothetical protein EDD17DRAFT_1506200 [Pisolithus thermaeus]